MASDAPHRVSQCPRAPPRGAGSSGAAVDPPLAPPQGNSDNEGQCSDTGSKSPREWRKLFNIVLVWPSGKRIKEYEVAGNTRIEGYVQNLYEGALEHDGVPKILDCNGPCHYELWFGSRKLRETKCFGDYRIPDGAVVTLRVTDGSSDGDYP